MRINKMITNIIFARKTWCSGYTNNLGLEIDCDKYKYLTIWGGGKEDGRWGKGKFNFFVVWI